MKTRFILIQFFVLVMAVSGYAQTFKVATYNIKYNIPENYKADSSRGEDWQRRGPAIARLIEYHKFEIFGTQEGLLHQLEDLKDWLPNFENVGVGRDDGKKGGEHAAIFFDKNRFSVMEKGDFWLSETPDKPSKGWDATCCNRLCSWALLKDASSDQEFFIFNAHFDHQGVKAREESAVLILQKINEIVEDKPVVFMGDLNGDHESAWYNYLKDSEVLNDTFLMVDDPYMQNGSFNGFGRRTESKNIIDHVFVSSHFKTNSWAILTDTYHGKFPSDHFPIAVSMTLE